MLNQCPPNFHLWLLRFSLAVDLLFLSGDFFIVTDTLMAFNSLTCAYLDFDETLVSLNFLIYFPKSPPLFMLWTYLKALWVPWQLPSCFLLTRHSHYFPLKWSCQIQSDLPFLDVCAQFLRTGRTSQRHLPSRWGRPQTQMLWPTKSHHENLESLTPNFHPVKNLESHTTVSHPEVLEQKPWRAQNAK